MPATTTPAPGGLLRFATAGSVDDGKSTLIGRLLYDSKSLLADHVSAVEAASRRRGMADIDLSLLTDGLLAEREQGITIDVAYRYFATAVRTFIVSDSPGHLQYTRNMVTAASTADVAVLLVDATKGLLAQTRRHAYLSRWVGIRRIVLAVNKMDLVGWAQARFDTIRAEFDAFAATLGFEWIEAIPLSALSGDMVVERGDAMPWYSGPTLLEFLETVPARDGAHAGAARFPVQRVVRLPATVTDALSAWRAAPGSAHTPDAPGRTVTGPAAPGADAAPATFGSRGYQGTIAAGRIAIGDPIVVLPAGVEARVARILRLDAPVAEAHADQAVTLVLDRELDVSRGDLFAAADEAPAPAREVTAEVCWFDPEALDPTRAYLLKHGAATVRARLAAPDHRVDVDTLARVAAPGLSMNDIGRLRVSVQQPLAFEPYDAQRATGAFILIDPFSHHTVAAGTVVADRPA